LACDTSTTPQEGEGGSPLALDVGELFAYDKVCVVLGDNIIECNFRAAAAPVRKYAVNGIYIYDSDVFRIIKTLKPGARKEL